jgi:hypothetical protein
MSDLPPDDPWSTPLDMSGSTSTAPTDAVPDDDAADRIAKARAMVKECAPPAGTPAAPYLSRRGIAVDGLPKGVVGWHGKSGAVLFVARDGNGEIAAVQRVLLNPDGTAKLKADNKKDKRTNGLLKGAAMILPGQGEDLLTEGPEDALSLWQATGQPVHCGFGVAALGEVPLPAGAVAVLVADNDPPDSPTHAAIGKAVNRLVARGFTVKLARPPAGVKDSNDLLLEQGAEAVKAMVADADVMEPPAEQKKIEATAEDGAWPAPDLAVINESRRPAPAFPTFVLGEDWQAWVDATAEGTSSPVDYAAVALLVIAAALIGNARMVSPWRSWKEACALWAALVGNPSSNKSPAMAPHIAIIRQLEDELADDYESVLMEWMTSSEAAKCSLELWQGDVKTAVKGNMPPPGMTAAAVVPEKPVRPRVAVSDTTPEKVVELLDGQPRGLLAYRDELSGWLGSFDRYGSGSGERGFWLEAFGGRSFTMDRVKLAIPIRIPHLTVSVVGGIQPDKLATCLMSGDDDGLAARMLMTWPEPVRPGRPKSIADDRAATDALRKLLGLAMGMDENGKPEPVVLPLTDEAATMFEAWLAEHADASASATGLMSGHLGKMPGLLLRLALVLEHLWWSIASTITPPQAVSVDAVTAAAGLLNEYFTPMAERCYGDAARPEADRLGATLARWIVKSRPSVINARDIRRSVRLPGMKDAAKVRTAIAALEDADWLRPLPSRQGTVAGRARDDHEINPLLWGMLP